jgi:hypothetical protein
MAVCSEMQLIRHVRSTFLQRLGAAILLSGIASAALAATSEWAYFDSSGQLAYKTLPSGERIMDFSHAGYMGGGVAIPTPPVKRTVKPSGGDDSTAIQNALNEVAALKLGDRGAVILAPGTFTCSNLLTIGASGVVLRGSGSGEGGTVIQLKGRAHTGITVRGRGETPAVEFKPAQATISDAYVPCGAMKVSVADAKLFAVGDAIEIRRPVTAEWIQFMRMDDLRRDGKAQTWLRAGSSTTTERRITAISGNTLTLDAPLSDSFDAKYLGASRASVVKVNPASRVSQVGVESLRITCPPQAINHTESHFSALRINAEDSWVRDVICEETMNSIGVNGRRITLQRVSVLRKAPHQGSSKPAEFAPNGTQVLLDRCSASGDNIWYVATGAGVAGPVVLLNCTFTGNGRAESHQRWSTGLLYDHCRVPGGGMDFKNRGSMGSGHGWTMGWGVAWNCEARDFVVQNPPGAVNWLVGCVGDSKPAARPFDKEPNLARGTEDSPGTPVAPESLYLAQLRERLGEQALRRIGY